MLSGFPADRIQREVSCLTGLGDTRGLAPARWFGHAAAPPGPRDAPVRAPSTGFSPRALASVRSTKPFAALRAYRLGIHHPQWPLQPAELQMEVNTMIGAAGIRLPPIGPLVHFAPPPGRAGGALRRL